MEKMVHQIFGEEVSLPGIERLNGLYSLIPVPRVPGLEKIQKNKFSLLKTSDGYDWRYGFMGNIIDLKGGNLPVMVLFPKVNYNFDVGTTLQRSIAIFGRSRNQNDYVKFMKNFIHSMRLQELFFCRARRIIKTGTDFFDEKQQLWCEFCRRTKPEKEFYFSRCGAVHKSCFLEIICE